MDLNKDNRNVYTIDSESYAMYMKENRQKPKGLLSNIIQFLMIIFLLILVYFFFYILKNDLTLSDVFNKKELLATYESFMHDKKVLDTQKKPQTRHQIKTEKMASEEPTSHKIAVVTKKSVVDTPHVAKVVESKVISVIKKKKSEAPLKVVASEPMVKEHQEEQQIVVIEEAPKPLKRMEQVESKKIVESKPVDVIENTEVPEESDLTENYLDRMIEELNSEI